MVEMLDYQPSPIERIASIVPLNVERREVAGLREIQYLATIEKFKRGRARRVERHSKGGPSGPSLFDEEPVILNAKLGDKLLW